jgi:hypothetical protein
MAEQIPDNMERVVARVRKMIALSKDAAATEGERDNAMRAAYATLTKYNLSLALLEDDKQSKQEGEKRVTDKHFGRGYPWAKTASQAVAGLFFCGYFYIRGKHADRCTHYYVGRESNAITAKEIADYVVESIVHEANTRRVKECRPWSWWTSFCKGATAAVVSRCYELRAQAERTQQASQQTSNTPGTALVLASFYKSEKEANDLVLASYGVVTSKSRERRSVVAEGYASGQSFGSNVSLHRQIEKHDANARRLK